MIETYGIDKLKAMMQGQTSKANALCRKIKDNITFNTVDFAFEKVNGEVTKSLAVIDKDHQMMAEAICYLA